MLRLITLLSLLFATPLAAHFFDKGGMIVDHPIAYETPPTARAGAGYFVLRNETGRDDRLLEIRADFPRVMLHGTEEADGVARMIHLDSVAIPNGGTAVFAPGGMHVMFMGLNGDPFEQGELFAATLIFEHADPVDIVFVVKERGAETAGESTGHAVDHTGH
ncbi:copper chaperone PCu(A)C [Roseobacteraceae bacterium S113]